MNESGKDLDTKKTDTNIVVNMYIVNESGICNRDFRKWKDIRHAQQKVYFYWYHVYSVYSLHNLSRWAYIFLVSSSHSLVIKNSIAVLIKFWNWYK